MSASINYFIKVKKITIKVAKTVYKKEAVSLSLEKSNKGVFLACSRVLLLCKKSNKSVFLAFLYFKVDVALLKNTKILLNFVMLYNKKKKLIAKKNSLVSINIIEK